MKQNWTRVLVLIVVALGVVAAQAQSNAMLKGTVPFAFTIGDQNLPAGTYTVNSMGSELQSWYDQNGKGLCIVHTVPMGKEADLSTYKLVFHRYGDRYFLSEIWNAGKSHEVRISDQEKELAKAKEKFQTVAVLMQPKF